MEKKNKIQELSESDLLIYGAYAKVAYSLQCSNLAQLTYKGASITWIIATYIGIGYSPSSDEIDLPFNPLFAVSGICLASLLVLCSLWYRDLIVEEKKIAVAVHQGLALEKTHPTLLPQVYHSVVKMNYLLGYVSKKSLFYISFATILLITVCADVTSYLFIRNCKLWEIIPFILIIIIPSLFFIANWMTKKTDPYQILKKSHEKKDKHGNR